MVEEPGPSYSADMQQYDGYGGADDPPESPEGDSVMDRPCFPVSMHQMRKLEQETKKQAQLVENRINHLERTEEQIWREMEDARRKAVKMELGKQRKIERKDASDTIIEAKSKKVLENQVLASKTKTDSEVARNEKIETREQYAKRAGTLAREHTNTNLQKKMSEQHRDRANKSQQAEDMRRDRELARARISQEKEERIKKLRLEQQKRCSLAERDLESAGCRLHDLDQREMACLDKLRLSLQLKQEAMQRIEASVGSSTVISSLLNTKAMTRSTMLFKDDLDEAQEQSKTRIEQTDRGV